MGYSGTHQIAPTARSRRAIVAFTMLALIATLLPFPARPADAAVFAFHPAKQISGISVNKPTAIDWGPDDRLYVMQQNGQIKVYDVTKSGGNYSASQVNARSTTLVSGIDNHNDAGSAVGQPSGRLSTGMIVTGNAEAPVIYATSSDPRISSDHENVDTNSGTVTKLTWNGTGYNDPQQVVQGLPRSRENHGPNGLHLDEATNTLYLAQGGNTNAGGPSPAFINLPEYALSAAILSIDLDAIGSGTCNLATLDGGDSTCLDNPPPWGGEGGGNMAKKLTSGPVQVYAPGFRNPYDVIITEGGDMYTIDNGLNQFFGDLPEGVNTNNCTNAPVGNNVGSLDPPSRPDHLEKITGPGYYGGHPNPTRGNPSGSGFSGAVPSANQVECDFDDPLSDPNVLATFDFSTNSIDEYTAESVFGGQMAGDLVAVEFSYDGTDTKLLRIDLNSSGNLGADGVQTIAQPGEGPLGVVALDDDEKFPGSIIVANHQDSKVQVFDPNSNFVCVGDDNPNKDEDGDGFDNADEIDAGTSPCNASDKPSDWDSDKTSDVNDPDDDNDGILDKNDAFAIDPTNGRNTTIPVDYQWENDSATAGGILGIGFTGLMTNGSANYRNQYDSTKMTVIGAAGIVTVDEVTGGDAYANLNDQDYAFQFGVRQPGQRYSAHTRLITPFTGSSPTADQSQGLFVGTGDQDNYFKVVVTGDGVETVSETSGVPAMVGSANFPVPGPDYVDLWITVDPSGQWARASYSVDGGARKPAGPAVTIPSDFVDGPVATGIISTSRGGSSFGATWDYFEVKADSYTGPGTPPPPPSGDGEFTDIGGSIFQEEINWLAASGITKGCNPPANTLFCPEDSVTRGQMAAFLHRALEDVLEPQGEAAFADDNTSVFEADIEWLGATGVTKGCNPPDNSLYCPDDPVTRGQMAAFLHRALGDILPAGQSTDFIDDESSVFEADIEWLAATGVTKGCNPPANTEFCPDDPVTREQMAAFLYRALG